MPFAAIHLRAGKPPDYLKALSGSVHRALVEAFEVPPTDCFQVIHSLPPEALVYDPHYLAGGTARSEDYVLVVVTAGRARSLATKAAFYRHLAACLAVAPGLRPEDLMVIIQTTDLTDWSFAGGVAATNAMV